MANNKLCDFAITELIHDFGHSIEGTDPGPESKNVIQNGRYKTYKKQFDEILRRGLPEVCKGEFTKYDEPGILKHVTNDPKIKEVIKSKQLAGKTITTINGKTFRVTIADRETLSEAKGGIELFDQLGFNPDLAPVILADTFSWVFKTFKLGKYMPTKKIIIFNPLVVRADSASKVNITDAKEMKKYFANENGIEMINVVDTNTFTCNSFATGSENEFFSIYSIKTSLTNNNQIQQEWSGLKRQGSKVTSIIRCPVDKVNNKTNTFNRMTQFINDQRVTSNAKLQEQRNAAVVSNLVKTNSPENGKNIELFNIELQAKRSGDWLPVLFILNYASRNTENLITFTDPSNQVPLPQIYNKCFTKNNMYILTIDTPLVSYALYSGVNVLYITANNTIVKFEYGSG